MFSAYKRNRTDRCRKLTPLVTFLVGYGASILAAGCAASPIEPKPVSVPNDVRTLIAPTDTLLAYKTADLYGDGSWSAVIVVRHQASEMSGDDFDHNPCDLLVLRRVNGDLAEVDRSSKTVDCTYNLTQRHAPTLSLNDDLDVAQGSITFVNQRMNGWSSLEFAWSKDKGTWYLHRATASNVDSENHSSQASLSYPKGFKWMPMSSIDPDAIARILE